MLKILNEKVLKSDMEIRHLYKDSKYVYIIDSYDKVVDDEGYLYCVSTSDDSYDELILCKSVYYWKYRYGDRIYGLPLIRE